ncbi:hypothetical protein B0G76_2871 [Paraburkholderia sp. BL23I1N1]|uniref:hypothetical protein n=1 Tax=Paraburkholderia sp. BL23I1N1 TaxID=1938802 RepID=UPI000E711820|nr:hypothetical protein [Paraburkholderia sp. BL23I1N1]RKE36669.1 hypothetical protein B0G76_2871 [Paraburkholderia sp. BL23I1N1]
MDFKSLYQGLATEERGRFAEIAGTTRGYIEVHLMTRRKIPKPALMAGLAAACKAFGWPVTQKELLAFFYRTASPETATAA